jgi:uncharacterized protein YoxC
MILLVALMLVMVGFLVMIVLIVMTTGRGRSEMLTVG